MRPNRKARRRSRRRRAGKGLGPAGTSAGAYLQMEGRPQTALGSASLAGGSREAIAPSLPEPPDSEPRSRSKCREQPHASETEAS